MRFKGYVWAVIYFVTFEQCEIMITSILYWEICGYNLALGMSKMNNLYLVPIDTIHEHYKNNALVPLWHTVYMNHWNLEYYLLIKPESPLDELFIHMQR